MKSSVATESGHHWASRRKLMASIRGGGVSRLLFRQFISKFQSDNLTGELERAYRASAFSHARQVRGFECREFGFVTRIVTALIYIYIKNVNYSFLDLRLITIIKSYLPCVNIFKTFERWI